MFDEVRRLPRVKILATQVALAGSMRRSPIGGYDAEARSVTANEGRRLHGAIIRRPSDRAIFGISGVEFDVFNDDALPRAQGSAASRAAPTRNFTEIIEKLRGEAALAGNRQNAARRVEKLKAALVGIEQLDRRREHLLQTLPQVLRVPEARAGGVQPQQGGGFSSELRLALAQSLFRLLRCAAIKTFRARALG
jgi:hypothetical protein